MLTSAQLRKIIALVYSLGIVLIIVAADESKGEAFFRLLKSIPCADKLGHFVLVGGLTFLLNTAFKTSRHCIGKLKLSLLSWSILVVMTLEELSQLWFPSRSPDVFDLLANYLGIFFFDAYSLRVRENGSENSVVNAA